VTSHYEVIQIGAEWCLRIRSSQRPVAWSSSNSKEFADYCSEAEADAKMYLDD
jgi:hypothetical protein